MEPLFDRLGRQEIVRRFFATVRACDKRSDNWMRSLSPEWRVPAAFGLLAALVCLVIGCLLFGAITILAIFLVLFFVGFVFLLPNLCLILFVKQSRPFKLVNLGIFLAYLCPVLAIFFDWESILTFFGPAMFLLPMAAMGHFIFLTFSWLRLRTDLAWKVMKFVSSMFVMTVICALVWETNVTGKIYCDGDEDFGYLTPGSWVSNWDGQHPIGVVHQIPAVRQYGDPDVIIEGWSIPKLWCLWLSCFGISLVVSSLFAGVQWIPLVNRTINTATESNCSDTIL